MKKVNSVERNCQKELQGVRRGRARERRDEGGLRILRSEGERSKRKRRRRRKQKDAEE